MIFAWDQTNRDHIATHDVTPAEAAFVVEGAAPPFPQDVGDDKRRVWGPTRAGRLLQVIYVLKDQSQIPFASLHPNDWHILHRTADVKVARVIHAMDLTPNMKRQLRRRGR